MKDCPGTHKSLQENLEKKKGKWRERIGFILARMEKVDPVGIPPSLIFSQFF